MPGAPVRLPCILTSHDLFMRRPLGRSVRRTIAGGLFALGIGLTACGDATDPSTLSFVSVSAASGYTCAATETGVAYCWGFNGDGQLGDGSTTDRLAPRRVSTSARFTSVSARAGHTCGITAGGESFCWGSNLYGQLGDGTTPVGEFPRRTKPVQVVGGLRFGSVSVGFDHTCALTVAGEAYCWGYGLLGERGDGGGGVIGASSPLPVSGGLAFGSLSAGHGHTCALTATGQAYCWGANHRGQLGDDSTEHRSVPTLVAGGLAFTAISAGITTTCGIVSGGLGYCWGDGEFGQLGAGAVASALGPIPLVADLHFGLISVGGAHACGITLDGTLYCWGRNQEGQLGVGGTDDRSEPTLVDGDFAFTSVSTGSAHTCATTAEHALYCWGSNQAGQLGDGTMRSSDRPIHIAGP